MLGDRIAVTLRNQTLCTPHPQAKVEEPDPRPSFCPGPGRPVGSSLHLTSTQPSPSNYQDTKQGPWRQASPFCHLSWKAIFKLSQPLFTCRHTRPALELRPLILTLREDPYVLFPSSTSRAQPGLQRTWHPDQLSPETPQMVAEPALQPPSQTHTEQNSHPHTLERASLRLLCFPQPRTCSCPLGSAVHPQRSRPSSQVTPSAPRTIQLYTHPTSAAPEGPAQQRWHRGREAKGVQTSIPERKGSSGTGQEEKRAWEADAGPKRGRTQAKGEQNPGDG